MVRNFSGSIEKSFEIVVYGSRPALTDGKGSILLAKKEYLHTGSEITPAVTVTYSGKTLKENLDYTVAYENNKDAGTAKVLVTGMNRYSGTLTETFLIIAGDLKDVTVSAVADRTYTGKEICPEPEVTLKGTVLKKGTDYEISYENNVTAGSAAGAKLVLTGKGGYTGTKEVTFTILPADIKTAQVTGIETSVVYTGSAYTPEPTVTFNGKTLTKDTDYTVAYENNTAVGNATVSINGKGNFTGTLEESFHITKPDAVDISGAAITVSGITDRTYNGSEQTQEVTVTLVKDGKVLIQDTDYTVSYKNNVNAGKATVSVSGKGDYTGTKETEFTISPCSLDGAQTGEVSDMTYTGEAVKPALTVTVAGTVLKEGTDYETVYTENVSAGEAGIRVTGKGNYTGERTLTFKIKAADIKNATVLGIPETVEYTGSAYTPEPTVTFNGKNLTKDTDYTVTYSNNKEAGEASVIITGAGNYSGTQTKSFKIIKSGQEEQTVYGDVNGDGAIDIADALLISRFDAGLTELNEAQQKASDVNGDGTADIADALLISRFDAGLITEIRKK